MIGRRRHTLLLAGSLGLNLALAGVLVWQATQGVDGDRRDWERDRRGGSSWESGSRRGAGVDSTWREQMPTREQLGQVRDLRREMEREIQPVRNEIRGLQRMLTRELVEEEPSQARLDSIMTEISTRQRILQRRSIELIRAEREIWTPEQYRWVLRFMVPGAVSPDNDPYDRGRRRDEGDQHRGDDRRDPPPDSDRGDRPPPDHRHPWYR
jgi:hypothetical protein